MAALTKKQTRQLRNAIYDAERALAYIQQDSVRVCRTARDATTTHHYTNRAGHDPLLSVAKDCGSDLCGLAQSVRALKSFVEQHQRSPTPKH
jgi:hypothetical protein